MKQIEVGISELSVCADPDATLVTGALGTTLAVVAWDPTKRVGGVLHLMLPSARVAPDKAHSKPAMFADTGILLLLSQLRAQGCRTRDLEVRLVGGGSLCGGSAIFDVGSRNQAAAREVLAKRRVPITAERVGGSSSLTARIRIRDGVVFAGARGEEVVL